MAEKVTFEDILGRVFDAMRAEDRDVLTESEYARLKFDFTFHMTDWLDDLKRMHALQEAPDVWTQKKATPFVVGFLYHVIPHLKAAGRILLGEIGDAFEGDETDQILARAVKAEKSAT